MKKGFTLMEVLTVVIIVGVLASLAIPSYRKVIERSRFTKAQVMAKSLHDSCERLVSEYGVEEYQSLPANVKTLSRLDIGSQELLPTGFTIDTNNNAIVGAGFAYTLMTEPSCSVTIDKIENGSSVLTISYDGEHMVCSGNEELCDIYGVDYAE